MRKPLDGVRVLELGQVYNGPYCGLLLAAQGADVIKVEPPGGEIVRRHQQSLDRGGASYSFCMLNAGKRGIVLNLKSERGRELLLGLAARADVLLENYREGALDALGLSWERLSAANPRLVVARGRGYGPGSEYSHFAAMDFTIQAISGQMAATGWPDRPPVKSGATLCDMLGATHLFAAILLALRERDATGAGRVVEVAMLDATFPALMSYSSPYLEHGRDPGRTGNRHSVPGSAPYGIYPVLDGWVAIMCVTDEHWSDFCSICADPELSGDPSLRRSAGRGARREWIDERVNAWSITFSRDDLTDRLARAGIPCAPVHSLAEACEDPYVAERGLLQTVDYPGRGAVRVLGSPIRLPDDPGGAPEAPDLPAPPPRLGEHTTDVLATLLGLAPSEIAALQAQGIIGADA